MTKQYEQIRIRLEEEREGLITRLDRLKKNIRRPNHPDFAEQATERENDEVLDALDDAGRAELVAIDQALDRIQAGQYGLCAECGEEIPMQRLEVLPFSVRCVRCADKESGASR